MIAVVDYKKGNLLSVERGLRAVGGDARITDDAAEIAAADAIVLPGVGAFADAVVTMNELGQMDAIRSRIAAGVPFLGICLGLHLLFAEGTEGALASGNPRGLGILDGCVDRMPAVDAEGRAFKVPHVGWNTIEFATAAGDAVSAGGDAVASAGVAPAKSCPLFEGIPSGTYFYFTHSYIAPATDAAVATTTHSVTFPCAVQRDNVFGLQFHPEKSSDAGAQVLRNFVEFAAAASPSAGN